MKKKGSALIVVIIVMMLIFSMSAYMLDASVKNNKTFSGTYNRAMAYYSAESGIYNNIYQKIKDDAKSDNDINVRAEGTYGDQRCIIIAHVSIIYNSQTDEYNYFIISRKIYRV
ncbi:hypothetical protein KM792_01770 [Clostridium tyrobutyricum]|uniref:hypothetical protein n=1 Tax=Clostridium tyrobutyricum TaxID=1519 RepID=UPI00073D4295|nr:hypothetical protein [Clostridium tyrobutyricum]MBV4448388.1 hypothetical protein [Clostridium tyrobutyricum]